MESTLHHFQITIADLYYCTNFNIFVLKKAEAEYLFVICHHKNASNKSLNEIWLGNQPTKGDYLCYVHSAYSSFVNNVLSNSSNNT